jgi:hypothetical protein
MAANLDDCMQSCDFAAVARARVQSASVAASSGDASGEAVAASSGDASGKAGPPKGGVIFGYIPKAAIDEALLLGLVQVMHWNGRTQHSPHTPTDVAAHVPPSKAAAPAPVGAAAATAICIAAVQGEVAPAVSHAPEAPEAPVDSGEIADLFGMMEDRKEEATVKAQETMAAKAKAKAPAVLGAGLDAVVAVESVAVCEAKALVLSAGDSDKLAKAQANAKTDKKRKLDASEVWGCS